MAFTCVLESPSQMMKKSAGASPSLRRSSWMIFLPFLSRMPSTMAWLRFSSCGFFVRRAAVVVKILNSVEYAKNWVKSKEKRATFHPINVLRAQIIPLSFGLLA